MDTRKAEALFIRLRDHLKAHDDGGLDIQIKNADGAVEELKSAASEEEKEDIIRRYYRRLWPPGGRGGLSDTGIWKEDPGKRAELNKYLEGIRDELKTVMGDAPKDTEDAAEIKIIGLKQPPAGKREKGTRTASTGKEMRGVKNGHSGNTPKDKNVRGARAEPAGKDRHRMGTYHYSGDKGPKSQGRVEPVIKKKHIPIGAIAATFLFIVFILTSALSVEGSGNTGNDILVWLAINALSALGIGAYILYFSMDLKKKHHPWSWVFGVFAGLIVLLYGMGLGGNVIRDRLEGPRTAVLYNCTVESQHGAHGIISNRYCLTGVDRDGKRASFHIYPFNCDKYRSSENLKVEYYENTGRLLKCEPEVSPAVPYEVLPLSFGDLEKSQAGGHIDSPEEVQKILLEVSENGKDRTIAIDLENGEVYLNKKPGRIYREKPDAHLDGNGTSSAREVLRTYGVLSWRPQESDDSILDGDSWLLLIQGRSGIIRLGGRSGNWNEMAPEGFSDFTQALMTLAGTEVRR